MNPDLSSIRNEKNSASSFPPKSKSLSDFFRKLVLNISFHGKGFFSAAPMKMPSALALVLAASFASVGYSDVVSIPDSALEQVIRDALDKPEGDITDEDMAGLTNLFASGLSITDLKGLGAASNIETLDLSNNQIFDISSIVTLENIQVLDLQSNDLNFSEGAPQRLYLNAIVGSGATVDFDDWTDLVVNIPDVNLLQTIRSSLNKPEGSITYGDMAGLTGLFAEVNTISDLTGLESAVNVTGLFFWRNEISDLKPLSNLTSLLMLGLDANRITDLSPLSGLVNLNRLVLNENHIVDISALSSLKNLTDLRLRSNDIVDLSVLLNFTNLNVLDLGYNPILDFTPLSVLTNLTQLSLDSNEISSLGTISDLVNLRILSLRNNRIVNIDQLSNLINLKFLYLGYNDITNLSALSGLIDLIVLNLSNNKIVDFSPLSGLINLTDLNLGYNYVSELNALSNFADLNKLTLSGNRIMDLSPLLALEGLQSLKIQENYLVLAEGSPQRETLDALLELGVSVEYDSPSYIWVDISNIPVLPFLPVEDAWGISIKSNGNWSVVNDDGWLVADLPDGSGSGTLSFTMEANPTHEVRVAEVTIKGEGNESGMKTFTIRQHGLVEGQSLSFEDWLGAYYLDTEISAMTPDADGADLDLDGLSNEDEWKLGFDPTSFVSRLEMTAEMDHAGTSVTVWPVPQGLELSLESSLDLRTWTPVKSPLLDESEETRKYSTTSTADLFYRIVIE